MKFCEKCGNQLNDDAVVCMGCGCAVAPDLQNDVISENKPKEPFSSKQSVIAIVLAGIGAALPFLGIIISFIIGPWFNMLVGAACIVASVIGLIIAIKAKKARSTDNLALIALIIAIVGIVTSAIIAVIYTVFTIISVAYLVTYIGIIAAYVVGFLAMLGLA